MKKKCIVFLALFIVVPFSFVVLEARRGSTKNEAALIGQDQSSLIGSKKTVDLTIDIVSVDCPCKEKFAGIDAALAENLIIRIGNRHCPRMAGYVVQARITVWRQILPDDWFQPGIVTIELKPGEVKDYKIWGGPVLFRKSKKIKAQIEFQSSMGWEDCDLSNNEKNVSLCF